MKRQWEELVQQHNSLTGQYMDPSYASVYGPALAARRARFLRDEHPAWVVFGHWLRPQIPRPKITGPAYDYWCLELGGLLAAGIVFAFDYDLCETVIEEGALDRLLLWQDWQPRCMLTLILHVRPHLRSILARLYAECLTSDYARSSVY